MIEQMQEASESAQTELALADIALMEATARQQAAYEAASRLEAAVAALSGEKPRAVEPPAQQAPKGAIHDLSSEEFDAERLRKQKEREKARRKEEEENNPYFHVKCSGCGRTGTMQDTIQQAPSGATVRMMVCYKCNNQVMS